jgi:hypothetical protein
MCDPRSRYWAAASTCELPVKETKFAWRPNGLVKINISKNKYRIGSAFREQQQLLPPRQLQLLQQQTQSEFVDFYLCCELGGSSNSCCQSRLQRLQPARGADTMNFINP